MGVNIGCRPNLPSAWPKSPIGPHKRRSEVPTTTVGMATGKLTIIQGPLARETILAEHIGGEGAEHGVKAGRAEGDQQLKRKANVRRAS